MRKVSLILIGLIAGFSVIGLSPVTKSEAATPHLNYLAFYLAGLSIAAEGEAFYDFGILGNIHDYVVVIAGNNVAFAWGTRLERLTGSPISPLAHAWYMHLGLSQLFEMWGSGFWLLSVGNLKSVGSIFPGVLEVYNDSIIEENGVCDTHFTSQSNQSEVLHYLYLRSYGGYNSWKIN